MASTIAHPNETENLPRPIDVRSDESARVVEELDRILASKFFRNAGRSRQFLEYVVRRKLEGHAEQLKERTIGAELFQRAPGYATGDDPVVRVQAGEVRRRLEQYYQSLDCQPEIRIELHPGSYSPDFHRTSGDSVPETSAEDSAPPAQLRGLTIRYVPWVLAGALLILILGAAWLYVHSRSTADSTSAQTKFWAPAFATPEPVLICLAKPIVYRPNLELYSRYSKTHPGTFQTEIERYNQVLPLNANDQVRWGDFMAYHDYGVAVGDVYAAVRVSSLLGQIGKPSQVRIGANYSFEDLSNSPSVIVGAYNNKWTLQIMRGMHFSFLESNGDFTIREQVPGGRLWRSNVSQSHQTGDDYAIVARLLDSKTGQFTVVAAGITGSGTQAAGDFISNSEFLERGLQSVASNWQHKDVEIVLKTTLTDSVAGPPQVIASYVWQ
jgi:hypothetical protein